MISFLSQSTIQMFIQVRYMLSYSLNEFMSESNGEFNYIPENKWINMSETSVKLSIRKCYVSYCNFSIFRYLHIDLLRTHYINCWKYLIFYFLSLHCEDFFKIDHNEIIYFQSKAYFAFFATADFNSAETCKIFTIWQTTTEHD